MKLLEKLKFFRMMRLCSKLLDHSLEQMMKAETMKEAEQPLFYIQKLADWCYPNALAAQGMIYSDETKPWYDKNKAIEAWEKAASLDGGESMYDLGMFYYAGRKDMEPDPISGRFWMNLAAKAGQKDAIDFLMWRYENYTPSKMPS